MLEPTTLNKLILLYALDKMEVALQEGVILDMVTENNWLSYMDCKVALTDLIKNNMITNVATKGCNPRYAITSDSREGLKHYFVEIPSSLRENIAEVIKLNKIKYRKKQDYFSDYYKNTDGTYTVVLKIESTNTPLMDLKLVVQNRNKAKWLFKNWSEKASTLYEFILENLID
ncbi:MAG: DUF4364 family protein [Clostridia bacterium]|nr:DUF4364 family protein [Clostridia bacterium]MDE7079169.1 DUF4364 family protein [Clostridia bacterium]